MNSDLLISTEKLTLRHILLVLEGLGKYIYYKR